MNLLSIIEVIADGKKTTPGKVYDDAGLVPCLPDKEKLNKLADYCGCKPELLLFLGLEETDVPERKQGVFRELNMPFRELILETLFPTPETKTK